MARHLETASIGGRYFLDQDSIGNAYPRAAETFEGHSGDLEDSGFPFSIRIPRAEIVSDGIFLSHVAYTIQWDDMGCTRTIRRRFRDFVSLDEKVSAVTARHHDSAVPSTQTTVNINSCPTVNDVTTLSYSEAISGDHYNVSEPAAKHWAFCWILSMLKPSHVAARSLGISYAKLPPKTVLRNKGHAFIETRRKQLETYLRVLMQHDNGLSSWPLWGFLKGDSASRAVAEFFLCSQPNKLLHHSHEARARLCRALRGLQCLAKGSMEEEHFDVSNHSAEHDHNGEGSCEDGHTVNTKGCSMWRTTHPDVARRLLVLGRKCSGFPLCIQIRVVDLLHILLKGKHSLQIICECGGFDTVFCILENACSLLYSVCRRLVLPLELPATSCVTSSREHGKDVEFDVSSRLESGASSCNDFINAIHTVRTGLLPHRRIRKRRGCRISNKQAKDNSHEHLPVRDGSFTYTEAQKTGAVPDRGNYGGNTECMCSFPWVSSSSVPLLVLLIDACTSFMCRLVDAEPSTLPAFLKHPDGVFRMQKLLKLRPSQSDGASTNCFDQQKSVVNDSSPGLSGSGQPGASAMEQHEDSLLASEPTAVSVVRQGYLGNLSSSLSFSSESNCDSAFLNYFACKCDPPCSPERVCRQQEEAVRSFVIMASPVVSSPLPNTLSQAFVAAQVATRGQRGGRGLMQLFSSLKAEKISENTCFSGNPATCQRSVYAIASLEAVDSRIHSCIALLLWKSIRLTEVQKCLTVPQSLGFDILACLYRCKASSTSRILSALILAVLLRESRFSNEVDYSPLQLPGAMVEQLVELLHGDSVLAKPASALLKSILRWQTTLQAPVGLKQRARNDQSVSPRCLAYPQDCAGSLDTSAFDQQTSTEGAPYREVTDTNRPIKAAEAISSMPFLISIEAFCADSWRLRTPQAGVDPSFLRYMVTSKALEPLCGLLDIRMCSPVAEATPCRENYERDMSQSADNILSERLIEQSALDDNSTPGHTGHSVTESPGSWDTEIAFFVCWLLAASATHSSSHFRGMHIQEEQQRHRSLDLQRLGRVRHKSDLRPNMQPSSVALEACNNYAFNMQRESDDARDELPMSHSAFNPQGALFRPYNYMKLLSQAIHGYDTGAFRVEDLVVSDFCLFENLPSPDSIGGGDLGVCEGASQYECAIGDEKTLLALVDQLQDSTSFIVQRLAALILLWCPGWWERVGESVPQTRHKGDIRSVPQKESHLCELLVDLKGKLQSLSAVDADELILSSDAGAARAPNTHYLRLHVFLVLLCQVLEEGNTHHRRLLQQQNALRHRRRLANNHIDLRNEPSFRNVKSASLLLKGTTDTGSKVSFNRACHSPGRRNSTGCDPPTALESSSSDTHSSTRKTLKANAFTKQVIYPCKERMQASLSCCRTLERKRSDLQRQLRAYQIYINMTRTKVEALVRKSFENYTLFILECHAVNMHYFYPRIWEMPGLKSMLLSNSVRGKACKYAFCAPSLQKLRMASIEQVVGTEMLPAFANAARLDYQEKQASEELEVAKAERVRVAGELCTREQALLKARNHSQNCTRERQQLQKQATSLRSQIGEVNQLIANAPLRRKHLSAQLNYRHQLLHHVEKRCESAEEHVLSVRLQLQQAQERQRILIKRLVIEKVEKALKEALCEGQNLDASSAKALEELLKCGIEDPTLTNILKELSPNSANAQPQNSCKIEELLQLLLNYERQERQLLEQYREEVSLDGTDLARVLQGTVERLEKEHAEAEEAYVEAQADLERHQQQILRAEEAIFQQTNTELLANMAAKLEKQLEEVVGKLDISTEEEHHAASAHQKEERAVKEIAECLKKLERVECEQREALEACQHAKREGTRRLGVLLLQSEAEMRQHWVAIQQLEMDQYNMQSLCRRVDVLLLEEEKCRAALRHELEVTSTAIAHSIRQLSHTNS